MDWNWIPFTLKFFAIYPSKVAAGSWQQSRCQFPVVGGSLYFSITSGPTAAQSASYRTGTELTSWKLSDRSVKVTTDL
jgi:hypothetical protein